MRPDEGIPLAIRMAISLIRGQNVVLLFIAAKYRNSVVSNDGLALFYAFSPLFQVIAIEILYSPVHTTQMCNLILITTNHRTFSVLEPPSPLAGTPPLARRI